MIRRLHSAERGAVAVVAGLFLVVLISAAAMAFDTGRLTWTKRSLQGMADDASLDAVRAVGDRRVPGSEEANALLFAQRSLERNHFDPAASGNSLTVTLGIGTVATRTFVPLPSGGPMALANGVKVSIGTITPHVFAAGESGLEGDSIAIQETNTTTTNTTTTTTTTTGVGGFSIGTFAARITAADSPVVTELNTLLEGILGADSDIDVAGYNGLVSSGVTLLAMETQLAAILGVGSPEQVLDATVTLGDLLTATANILSAGGTPDEVAAETALRSISRTLPTDRTFNVRLKDLLHVTTSDPADGASARLNVLNLLEFAVEISNYDHFASFSVPVDPSAVEAGVTSANLAMSFVETPAIAIGPAVQDGNGNWITRAHTAQTRLLLTMTVADGVTIGEATFPIVVPVYVEAGGADGWLTSADCSGGNVGVHAQTDPLRAWLGTVPSGAMMNKTDPVTVTRATLVDAAGLVKVYGEGSASINGGTADLTFAWGSPPGSTAPAHQTAGSSSLNIGDLLNNNITVTTDPAVPVPPGIATTVGNKVNLVMSRVDAQLKRVMKLLALVPAGGTTLAGADVDNFHFNCAPVTTTVTTPTTTTVPGRRRLIG